MQKLVIFDTDPGIDDAMALLFLRAQRNVKLLALTTVFGNSDVDTTTRNALYLTQRFNIDAPVFRGADQPLGRERGASPEHVHGSDALGDIGLLEGFSAEPAPGEAADRIIELVRAHPGEISLLAVGPLTNLGTALQRDPAIAGLVREVAIMGGAFSHAGQRGNVTPAAEANIHNDPHAADLVFTASWPLTIVGLDVTSTCVLPHEEAARLAETGEAGRFLWDISRVYEDLYRRFYRIDGCCMHDVTAALCLLHPDLFTLQLGAVRALTEGIAAGHTIQKPDGANFGPSGWDGQPSQRVCIAADHAALLRLYAEAIEGG